MLAPRRGCLGYSKVYCDVRKRWFLAWNQNRHITYYIFHIQNTNFKLSIGLLYIRPDFVWWHRLNHCAAFVRNLPISILVRAPVSLLTFHFGPCLGKFVDIPYINYFCAIMVYEFRVLQIPEPLHFHAVLSC